MTLTNFIPQVWSAKILQNLHKALVYGQTGIVNRDYEGEISQAGDTVKINSIGAVTVFDYTRNTDMPAPETLTDAQRTLVIDQSKGFNFQVDDIDKAQQKPKVMDEASREAAYALANTSDQFLAAKYVDASNTIGSDGAAISVTAANAYDQLVLAGQKLDESNVPSEGRWTIVPPWFRSKLLLDPRFIDASRSADGGAALRNGQVGEAAGFQILKSNNVHNAAGKYHIMAGHAMGLSFAEQITETEAYRPERRFGDALKGLHVYGAKVVRPAALVALTATDGG